MKNNRNMNGGLNEDHERIFHYICPVTGLYYWSENCPYICNYSELKYLGIANELIILYRIK